MPAPSKNFAGLDRQNWGSGWPPDTNGDVGTNYYVQTVNISFGVFDKATGAQIAGSTLDDLFFGRGTGTPCDNAFNQGDPIALYDSLADRWLISDFAWNDTGGIAPPFYECVAVSKTSDPVSGGWWFYGFQTDAQESGSLADYPKWGVWPDAYYMTANMFDMTVLGTPFTGIRVWALDRKAMLKGQPLTTQSFSIAYTFGDECCFTMLPSNVKGAVPPVGRPNYLLSASAQFGSSSLHLSRFHVDWGTPANSTFVGPLTVTVTAYTYPMTATLVPQKNTTVPLDSLADRLMAQLQYRNIGGIEALWVNHTIQSGGVTGIRWYEIRNPNGTPSVNQQATFQPDSNYRWTGSIAVDNKGDAALGYSVSSAAMFPAIVYAGRLVSDTANTLSQSETVLWSGTGSQSGTCGPGAQPCSRWGDYSAMTVDPTDDCTFWYTNEYYATTGLDWLTRVGAFKFPSCTSPTRPSYISPSNGASVSVAAPVSFTWSTTGATQCSVNVWKDGGASTNSGAIPCGSWSGGLLPLGSYHWQVKAVDASGGTIYGPVWDFSVAVTYSSYMPFVMK